MKNTDRDELHDMIREVQECMDDGPDIPELSDKVKLTNILIRHVSIVREKLKGCLCFPYGAPIIFIKYLDQRHASAYLLPSQRILHTDRLFENLCELLKTFSNLK